MGLAFTQFNNLIISSPRAAVFIAFTLLFIIYIIGNKVRIHVAIPIVLQIEY